MGHTRVFLQKSIIAIIGLSAGFGCNLPAKIDPDKVAPPFKGRSPRDGKAYSLLDSLIQGPALVVFIPRGCAAADEALQYFSLLESAYRGKAMVIGVYVDQEDPTKKWLSSRPNLKIPIIPDVDHHFIEQYKFERGPAAVLVATSSEIVGRWEGWSASALDEMNSGIAKLLKVEKANIDTKSAQSTLQAPCTYN